MDNNLNSNKYEYIQRLDLKSMSEINIRTTCTYLFLYGNLRQSRPQIHTTSYINKPCFRKPFYKDPENNTKK